MALDPTARSANIKDSLKKYFVDNIYRSSGIDLTFDKAFPAPKIQGKDVNRWIYVRVDELELEQLSTQVLSVYCCTRQDNEGFRLAQTLDTLLGYLVDITQTDGLRRVPFYRSYESSPWELIGSLLVTGHHVSSELEGPDQSKFRVVTITLRFASKV